MVSRLSASGAVTSSPRPSAAGVSPLRSRPTRLRTLLPSSWMSRTRVLSPSGVRRDAIAGGCGGTPDRDLGRPALEPQRNELDLARRELSGIGEIDQQNLRVGFRARRLSALVARMGDFVSSHAPILGERIDAVQQLPFALADVLIGLIAGGHLLPGAPQDALAYQGCARAGSAARDRFQTVLISV